MGREGGRSCLCFGWENGIPCTSKKNNTKWKWIKISQDPLEGQMAGVSTLFEGEKIQ